MKPSRLLPFTILFAATAFSQDVIKVPAATNSNGFVVEDSCPVDMAIDRNGLYEKREVAGAPATDPNPSVEQRIRLDFTNRKQKQIIGAQVTIHGLSQKTRYIEVSTAKADMAKQIQLSLDLKGEGKSSRVLWLTRFAAITRVDLNAVTYSDGSEWREPSPAACSVEPSKLVRLDLEMQR